jgi:hypothetical protein
VVVDIRELLDSRVRSYRLESKWEQLLYGVEQFYPPKNARIVNIAEDITLVETQPCSYNYECSTYCKDKCCERFSLKKRKKQKKQSKYRRIIL